MSVSTSTHLNFRGDARAALEFYRSVFGGELVIATYADAHRIPTEDEANNVIWGQVEAENGFRVMAYDVPSTMPWNQGENSYFVSVRGDSAEEITELWARLVEGATVVEDLAPSGWSPLYGMARDGFGVIWVLDVAAQY